MAEFGTDHPGAEAQNIDVIVFNGLMCGIDVMADSRVDPFDLIGCQAHPDAGAADKDPFIGLSRKDLLRGKICIVRKIDAVVRIGADVNDFKTAFTDRFVDDLFEIDACMIKGSYYFSHFCPSFFQGFRITFMLSPCSEYSFSNQ